MCHRVCRGHSQWCRNPGRKARQTQDWASRERRWCKWWLSWQPCRGSRRRCVAGSRKSCPTPPPPPQVLPDTSGVAGPQPVTAPFPTPRVGVACARQGPAPIPALRRRDKEQLLSPPLAHPPAQPELEVSVGGTCYTIAGGGGGMRGSPPAGSGGGDGGAARGDGGPCARGACSIGRARQTGLTPTSGRCTPNICPAAC